MHETNDMIRRDKVIQISQVYVKDESRVVTTVLTDLGRMFCNFGGSSEWKEIEPPNLEA